MCGHIASPHLLWGFCLHPEKAVQDQKASPLPAASRGADPGIGLVGRGPLPNLTVAIQLVVPVLMERAGICRGLSSVAQREPSSQPRVPLYKPLRSGCLGFGEHNMKLGRIFNTLGRSHSQWFLAKKLCFSGEEQHPYLQLGTQQRAVSRTLSHQQLTNWEELPPTWCLSQAVASRLPKAVGRLFKSGGYVWVTVCHVMDTTVCKTCYVSSDFSLVQNLSAYTPYFP